MVHDGHRHKSHRQFAKSHQPFNAAVVNVPFTVKKHGGQQIHHGHSGQHFVNGSRPAGATGFAATFTTRQPGLRMHQQRDGIHLKSGKFVRVQSHLQFAKKHQPFNAAVVNVPFTVNKHGGQQIHHRRPGQHFVNGSRPAGATGFSATFSTRQPGQAMHQQRSGIRLQSGRQFVKVPRPVSTTGMQTAVTDQNSGQHTRVYRFRHFDPNRGMYVVREFRW